MAVHNQRNLGDLNNPEQYMENLRNQQAVLARMQQSQGLQSQQMNQGGGQQQMMNMNIQQMRQQQQQQQQQQQSGSDNDLARQFAAMQNALQQGQQQRPGTGMG